jgi:hypothetical protein
LFHKGGGLNPRLQTSFHPVSVHCLPSSGRSRFFHPPQNVSLEDFSRKPHQRSLEKPLTQLRRSICFDLSEFSNLDCAYLNCNSNSSYGKQSILQCTIWAAAAGIWTSPTCIVSRSRMASMRRLVPVTAVTDNESTVINNKGYAYNPAMKHAIVRHINLQYVLKGIPTTRADGIPATTASASHREREAGWRRLF